MPRLVIADIVLLRIPVKEMVYSDLISIIYRAQQSQAVSC
jgi:hypothetical protein